MGADLYIHTMPRKAQYLGFEVSRDAVKVGYFRDCYNSWGLFSIMSGTLGENFSWWNTLERTELFGEIGKDKVMTPEGVKIFWEGIEPKIREFIKRKTYYRSEYVSRNKYKKIKITKNDDIKAIREHAELFARFHVLAVELGSPVIWSV